VDVGGTLMKFVYRSKADVTDDAVGNLNRLHLVAFNKHEMAEALAYIHQRADITTDGCSDGTATIYTAGTGSSELSAGISEGLGVQIENLSEFDCNPCAFYYLAHRLSRDQLLEPFVGEAIYEPMAEMRTMKLICDVSAASGLSRAKGNEGLSYQDAIQRLEQRASSTVDTAAPALVPPIAEAEPEIFPCLIVACGSSVMFTVISGDGEYHVVDGLYRCGSALLGLGNLILGTSSFEELVEMASRGDSHNVDKYTDFLVDSEHFTSDPNDLFYVLRSATSPFLLYSFGRAAAARKDELKREDIARSLLGYVIRDVIQSLQYLCLARHIRRVFFFGGFCDHPFVRRLITAEFVCRMLHMKIFDEIEDYIEFDFVKAGMYLGALGCAVNDVEKFLGK
jgi:pantothenate kinase